ncbi:uncharacterized protein [Diadema antillarum]|uniref:uncharacterized protein isoform X1 n=1 Tax=Diadema antillarum TaxID=105358 RepID=UPI003A837E66
MMSSMGSTRGNTRSGGRGDKSSQKSSSQTVTAKSTPTEPQQPVGKKATQEQMRIAQIIADPNTVDNEVMTEKVEQVRELTNRSEHEVMVALHDSNYDTEQAIILLLESEEGSRKDEWETISSKKNKGRNTAPSARNSDFSNNHDKDHKGDDDRRERGGRGRNRDGRDNRDGNDKGGDREGSFGRGRGRGGRGNLPPRMTRGRGRDRDGEHDRDRNSRNESGRGRGRRNAEMNGPSRRSNRGGGGGSRSFTNSKFGNFQEEDAFKSTDNVWRNPPETESWDDAVNSNTQPATKTGDWATEEWGTDDWTGDLTESQVFTPSSNPVPPMPLDPITNNPPQMQNPVGQPPSTGLPNQGMPPPPSHSMDVQSSLGTGGGMGGSSPMGNSGGMGVGSGAGGMKAGGSIGQPPANAVRPTPPPGNIGQPGGGMMPGMGQPQAGMVQPGGSMGQPAPGMSVGGSLSGATVMGQGVSTTMPDMSRSIDLAALFGKSVQPPTTSLGGVSDQSSARDSSSSVFSQFRDPKAPPSMNSIPGSEPPGKPAQQVQMGMDQSQGGSQMPVTTRAPTQSKPARKKLPPPSTKIPASAVEMPNSARSLGTLDVQFGAMDIAMDPAVSDFGLSSSSMPSSVSLSSTLSSTGGLANSAFSVNSSGTSANHMPYSKSSEPPYATSTGMAPGGLTSTVSTPSSVSQQSLDQSQQRAPQHYGQSTQQKQMTPEPIPLPNQSDIKTNTYLSSQKPTSAQSMDNKDKTASQLSQLASLSSSSGFGLSTSQSLGGSRQVPNSYGSSSISVTSSSQYQTSDLSSGSSAFSTPMGSSALSSGLSSGPSNIGYSSSSQSASSGLTGAGSTHQSVTVAGSSLSSSGHLAGGLSASSNVSQATTTLSSSKLSGLDTRHAQSSLSSSSLGSVSTSLSSASSTGSSSATSVTSSVLSSTSLGYPSQSITGSKTLSQGSAKLPPNLPPGMPFMYHPNLIGAGFPLVNTIPTHQPMYGYEDFQMQLSRLPMPFQQLAATTLNTGRETNSLGNTAYSVTEASKFPRNDAASPVATSLSTQQHQPSAGSAIAGQGAHHQTQTQQQTPFLNTTLPPGYAGYGTLPYYPAGPGMMPPGLQYPAVFPAVSSVQPTNRGQTGTTPHSAFQQSGYTQPGSHNAYGTGYDELSQTQDFSKGGYSGLSQSQSKGTGVTAARGSVSVTSASTGPTDLAGSSYPSKSHNQAFDNKGGFHTGTPPPFNYQMTAVTQAGALNPAAAAGGAPTAYHGPFVPILPHHSATMLAHQLPGDNQGAGSTGRSQGAGSQSSKTSKQSYGTNYWPS